MKKGRTRAIIVAAICVAVGAGLMAYPLISDAWYSYWQSELEIRAAMAASHGKTAPGGVPLPDGAVAKLAIPGIGLRAYVVEGTTKSALARGPGHYEETPMPGQAGNVGIAGHRTMYGHPFNKLDELKRGDAIVLWTESAKHVYRVTQITSVDPSDTSVVAQTAEPTLTLTTCHPKGSARQRLVVAAALER